MGDLFDEFMRELERRRAEAEGRVPKRGRRLERGDPDGAEAAEGETPTDDTEREMSEPGARAGDLADDADDETMLGEPPDDESDETDAPDEADEADQADERQPIQIRRGPRRTRARTTGGGGGGAGRPPGGPGGPGGPDDGAGPPSLRTILRRMGLAAIVVLVIVVLITAGAVLNIWTDAIWYQSVGFADVFWTRIGAQSGMFVGGLLLALVVLLGNLAIAGRLVPPVDPERPGRLRTLADRVTDTQRRAEWNARLSGYGGPFGGTGQRPPTGRAAGEEIAFALGGENLPDVVPMVRWLIAGFAVLLALGVAGALAASWETVLLWLNRVPFSPSGVVADPVFGRDISFFLFELPFFRLVQGVVNGLLLASLAIAGARYLLATARGGEVFITRVRVHLALLGGLYLLSVAFGYQLDKYELVYSHAGVATGVAFADANARFIAYDVLTFLSGIAGALLVGGAFTRWLWPLGAIVAVWFAASVLLGSAYPEVIQRFTVDPNTFSKEEPYIANNIAMTRLAFDVDAWVTKPYNGEQPLTESSITGESDTFANARLWDYRPLQTTLDQLQTVRQYYDFHDVDTDRYTIDGNLRQVMLSGRELAIEKNPSATSWVNQRIIYTHGIGLAMVPVNEVTPEGQPRLWVRDLPPVSSSGAPTISEPRIYFGEGDDHYVVVRAQQAEFDFPSGSGGSAGDVKNSWTGSTGIPLDSTLMRLLYGLRFRDLDLLISDQVKADSQLLIHRTLDERLGLIAPFLRFDKDPYLVIDGDGRLVYVQDAYTVSDRFPHATAFDPGDLGERTGLGGSPINYLRNSVKITMDAYDGTMHFYIADPSDPLVRAWSGVFPSLFTSLEQMPADLRAHLRAPEEQFNVQTRVFGRYHVQDPLVFFSNNDRWTVPEQQTNEQVLPSEAYYVVMRMPGESAAEFLLLQPMIAASRPNMIAWVAARNDAPNYGQVRVFQFPSDTTIFGPKQIEGRIDQDPTISAQVTLWNTSGSKVLRGNLIVVPVGDSLLYLQPVYLQSTAAAFPEFQRIVVASPTTVVWGHTLSEALNLLLQTQNGSPGPSPGPTPTPSPGATPTPGPGATATPAPTPGSELPGDVPGLVAYANQHYEAAQTALRNGDFATYGTEIAKMQAALQRLVQLTASPGASAQP